MRALTLLLARALPLLAGPLAGPKPFPAGVGPDGTKYKTAYKCEGEQLTISCAADQTIKVIRANFGRFSIAICNRHGTTDMSVNCMSPSSNRVMKRKCDGSQSCSIDINASAFGDPCPATPKYLEVHYGCVPRAAATTNRPLPAWFLQGGSDQLWETRIPDPPEGFEEDALRSSTVAAPTTVTTEPADRIPITTPTGTPATSTTTTTTSTTSTEPPTTLERESQQPLVQPEGGMAYYPLPRVPDVQVITVDIPVEEQALHCPPASARSLAWNWTAAGDTAIQPCPAGTTGLARWTCGLPSGPDSPVFWTAAQPDLSDCKTLAMSSLEGKVEDGDLENVISASLAHLTRVEVLYGGDVEASAAIMRTLSNRIQYLLQTQGDKFYNKGQYIQEVLLNMVRAASNLFDMSNRLAWQDLHSSRQIKAATGILLALEENAFLFLEVTGQEEVMVEAAQNILMSVSIMEIGRSTNGSQLPVDNFVDPFGEARDHLVLPFNVLWEQARSGITKLVHFSFKNLHQILGQADMDILPGPGDLLPASIPRSSMSLNSRIISASFGRGRKIQFPNSVEMVLRHLEPVDPSRPASSVCAVWDPEQTAWSNLGCTLASSNASHSVCHCSRLGYTALITAPNADGPSAPSSLPVVTLQIVTYIVAAISVLCVLLILVKFRQSIHKLVLRAPCLSQGEKHACNPRPKTCPATERIVHLTLQNNLTHRALATPTISKPSAPELLIHGQDGSVSLVQPNHYRTTFADGQPVMVTLNPYSTQLVDNLNKMMGSEQEVIYDNTMNPQLAKLTATLRKKVKCEVGHPGPCRQACFERQQLAGLHQPGSRSVNPEEVVFRAVSPHGHVYWEINPSEQAKIQGRVAGNKSQQSSSSDDTNTNSDLQNISDFSDDDNGRAASEMSRQSSSRFSESRPLIYSSSASTSPGHSAGTPADLVRHAVINDAHFNTARAAGLPPRPRAGLPLRAGWGTMGAPHPALHHEEVYAYAATDFSQGEGPAPVRDCRAVPVSVKSRAYILAKIADYTERSQETGQV